MIASAASATRRGMASSPEKSTIFAHGIALRRGGKYLPYPALIAFGVRLKRGFSSTPLVIFTLHNIRSLRESTSVQIGQSRSIR